MDQQPMVYSELSESDQYAILTARLKQYEQRHFDATLNLAAIEAAGDPKEAERIRSQIANLAEVIQMTRDSRAAMDPPSERAIPHLP